MTLPRATARLQLHSGFTLTDAQAQVPYYAGLGISHLYLSPISQARPGSTHGYDVVNHQVVSPELGAEEALVQLARTLREHDMGLVLDIVPNHMATHPDNRWWWDVLQYGRDSVHAKCFDINWNCTDASLRGKVLAPFLANDYGKSLADGSVALVYDENTQAFQIQACGMLYPLAAQPQAGSASIQQVLALHDSSHIEGRLRLHQLLEQQHYRLSWWRCAGDSINWRRFFDISELIGVRVEEPAVFDAVHALPLRLFQEGLIDGLRIDHVDGLAEPLAYCKRLQSELQQRSAQRPGDLRGNEAWLIVEKILANDEVLDVRWAVHGSSGYDFMDQVGAVMHDPAGQTDLTALWDEVSGDTSSTSQVLSKARSLMLCRYFSAERSALLDTLVLLALSNPATRDWTRQAIAGVLDMLLVVFPVYRTYAQVGACDLRDAKRMTLSLAEVQRRFGLQAHGNEMALLGVLKQWLSGDAVAAPGDDSEGVAALQKQAIQRFEQLTPPLAAKSLEDTAFYRYGRILSRNEVGSDPGVFAIPLQAFHRSNTWRATHRPLSMLATATHDHKRGEDARARLATLTECPELWVEHSQRWLRANTAKSVSQAAERYMLMQTLVGAWPLDLSLQDAPALSRYAQRIVQWQIKALREAKLHSNWSSPNLDYEQASADYVEALLTGPDHALRNDIEAFVQSIAAAGVVNSLAQTVLRMTVPGIPDLYQGTEFWDFSLVDPDNRRPVDFAARRAALTALNAGVNTRELLIDWRSGRVKQAVVFWTLQLVRERADVFSRGQYFSLPVVGAKSAHVLAFLRSYQGQYVFVIVPRFCSKVVGAGRAGGLPAIDAGFWDDTGVVLPRRFGGARLCDVLGGRAHHAGFDGVLRLSNLFDDLSLALLVPA